MSDTTLVFSGDDGEEILFEILDDELGYRGDDDKEIKRASKTFQKALRPLKSIANQTLRVIRDFSDSPEEVSLEVGVKMGGEGNVYFTKVSGDVHFKITIKWGKETTTPKDTQPS